MPEFEMILRGSKIPGKKAPIDVLGRFLWSIQATVENIAHAILSVPRAPDKKKQFHQDIQLYLMKIGGGESVVVDIGTERQETLPAKGQTRAEKVFDALFASIDAIQNSDEKEGRTQYANIISKPVDRVRVLGSLKPLWVERDVQSTFRPRFTTPKREYGIDLSYKTRVDNWLRLEPGIDVGGFMGLITELKARGERRYFVMQDERGDSVKCFYPPELETEILAVFKTPVRVEVELTRKTQRHLIGDFGSVEKMETITFTSQDYPALKTVIEFPLEYDRAEDFWIAERADLALRLVSDTLDGLRKEFAVLVDYMVDRYLIQKEQSVTPKLKQAIEALAEIVDVGKRPMSEHWVLKE